MAAHDLRQTLFEVNNARTQSLREVVGTFVPPDSFWRLLSAKNHVVLGSRGSGKTAVLKMLAHDHLSQFDNATAQRLIRARSFIGTYVAMRTEWIGTLKNKPWLSEAEGEAWFQWRLNISAASSFVETMQSCIKAYVDGRRQPIVEKQLCELVSASWSSHSCIAHSFAELRAYLEDVEWQRQTYAATPRETRSSKSAPGAEFDAELFAPLRRAITLLQRVIDIPRSAVWLVCLDEIEFLDWNHHRILNTHMRSSSGNVYFKMATMPYFHHTLKTNAKASLAYGHDFEYVYLDFDPAWRGTDKQPWLTWAEEVLDKRLTFLGVGERFSFADILGSRTPLLDEKDQDWTINSPMMGLLKRYATPETYDRARRLADRRSEFRDQISRKIHGNLLLRRAADFSAGNADTELYGGPKMIVRCSDANPRQLIRIFNALSFRNPDPKGKIARVPISKPSLREQTRVMIENSQEALAVVAFEEGVGDRLAGFVRQLCEYFNHRFYDHPVSTDHFFAVTVDEDIDDETWLLVRFAVGLGLLFPKGRPGSKKADVLPGKGGTFNLAYRLAPAYGLMPRRGRSVSLKAILRTPRKTERVNGAFQYSLPAIESSDEETPAG